MEHMIEEYKDLDELLHYYDLKKLLKNTLLYKVDFNHNSFKEIFHGNACSYIEEGHKGTLTDALAYISQNTFYHKRELLDLLKEPQDNHYEELDVDMSIYHKNHMLHIISLVKNKMGYFFVREADVLDHYDFLTGLYNRFYYEEMINEQSEGVLVLFDIDHFRAIKTRSGLKKGDRILIDIAKKIKNIFPEALICRQASDEFLVFCKKEEHLQDKISFFIDNLQQYEDVCYRMSAGLAFYKEGDDFQSLYRRAFCDKEQKRKSSDVTRDQSMNSFAFDDIVNGLPGALLIYKATRREEILYVNKELLDIFECQSFEEFMEHTQGSFKTLVYEEDIDDVEHQIWQQVNTHNKFEYVRYRIKTKLGVIKDVENYGKLSHNPLYGDIFYVFIHDLGTKREILNRYGVYHNDEGDQDVLTQLKNYDYYRTHALHFYDTLLSQGIKPAFIYLDVVNFKLYNEKYGFMGGDGLLRRIGKFMKEIFTDSLIARISGDHFVIVTDERFVHERVKALHERVNHLQKSVYLDIKAGIYVPELEHVSDGALACDCAKMAYNQIKDNYREYECYYSSKLKEHYHKRKYIESHFKEALNNGNIKTYFQPVIDVKTNQLFGFEALSRWIDPRYGMIPTESFIEILEDAHLVYELDLHTLEEVCQIIAKRKEHGEEIYPVSVNLSRLDFENSDLIVHVIDILDKYQVDKTHIHVEVTESMAFNKNDFLKRQVDLLRFHNLEVWMDDFGSGYSSLNALQEFDFNVIKMDMGFMKNFSSNNKSQMIMETIMTMAHKMGLKTLVEGVETKEQFAFLRECGCDLAQGFLFGKPEPWGDYFLKKVIDD